MDCCCRVLQGAIEVFVVSGAFGTGLFAWLTRLYLPDPSTNDHFGKSVALSGLYLTGGGPDRTLVQQASVVGTGDYYVVFIACCSSIQCTPRYPCRVWLACGRT